MLWLRQAAEVRPADVPAERLTEQIVFALLPRQLHSSMASRWHQGAIAPRALKNKKNENGGNAPKQILILRAF